MRPYSDAYKSADSTFTCRITFDSQRICLVVVLRLVFCRIIILTKFSQLFFHHTDNHSHRYLELRNLLLYSPGVL